ncbi:MAG: YitT family protein [Faecalimonas sp.]|nr:YitT family protein [Tyzzerella sp.]MEE0884124.1 YitT family protein [Faecalimonas sp.]
MDKKKIKNIAFDLAADIIGSFLIAIGIYNFATASEFPVTGITGIAQVLYIYFGLPIGTMTTIINIPIILACVKVLGVKFVLKSLKTLLISNFFMDVVAPLLPIYEGDLMLSSICMGLFAGLGYALIFMRDSSTGGVDFISLTIRALKPHISLGRIIVIVDCVLLLVCGFLLGGNVDKIIYGLIATYIVSVVVDKVMYGLDAGKVTLIVTEKGYDVAEKIHELTERGATLLKAVGSHTKTDKQVVMCACSYKQMHMVQKAVKEVDSSAFLVMMEANQVRGEGFRPYE